MVWVWEVGPPQPRNPGAMCQVFEYQLVHLSLISHCGLADLGGFNQAGGGGRAGEEEHGCGGLEDPDGPSLQVALWCAWGRTAIAPGGCHSICVEVFWGTRRAFPPFPRKPYHFLLRLAWEMTVCGALSPLPGFQKLEVGGHGGGCSRAAMHSGWGHDTPSSLVPACLGECQQLFSTYQGCAGSFLQVSLQGPHLEKCHLKSWAEFLSSCQCARL